MAKVKKGFVSFLIILGLIILVLFFIRDKFNVKMDFIAWIANSVVAQIITAIAVGFVAFFLVKAFINFIKINLGK
jgi:hypothetical protein